MAPSRSYRRLTLKKQRKKRQELAPEKPERKSNRFHPGTISYKEDFFVRIRSLSRPKILTSYRRRLLTEFIRNGTKGLVIGGEEWIKQFIRFGKSHGENGIRRLDVRKWLDRFGIEIPKNSGTARDSDDASTVSGTHSATTPTTRNNCHTRFDNLVAGTPRSPTPEPSEAPVMENRPLFCLDDEDSTPPRSYNLEPSSPFMQPRVMLTALPIKSYPFRGSKIDVENSGPEAGPIDYRTSKH